MYTPPKTNMDPEKGGGWKMISLFSNRSCSGSMLVFGGVSNTTFLKILCDKVLRGSCPPLKKNTSINEPRKKPGPTFH